MARLSLAETFSESYAIDTLMELPTWDSLSVNNFTKQSQHVLSANI